MKIHISGQKLNPALHSNVHCAYNEKSNNYFAIKLNHLKDKEASFESHEHFRTRCIIIIINNNNLFQFAL